MDTSTGWSAHAKSWQGCLCRSRSPLAAKPGRSYLQLVPSSREQRPSRVIARIPDPPEAEKEGRRIRWRVQAAYSIQFRACLGLLRNVVSKPIAKLTIKSTTKVI